MLKLKKNIVRVYGEAAKLTVGLCPDDVANYIVLMDTRALPMSTAYKKLDTMGNEFVAGTSALGMEFPG